MAKPEKTTLPSDKYESHPPPAQPAPEPPKIPQKLLEQIDLGIKHLLGDPTNWRIPVPVPLERWQPMRYAILDGDDAELQKVRDSLSDVYFRIYPGFASKELLMVVRVPDTAYLRAEVLPWTIGK